MAWTWVYIANLMGPPGDANAMNRFNGIDAAIAALDAKTTNRDNSLASDISALDTKTMASDAELERTKVAFADRQAPQEVGATSPYTHAWADSAGRVGAGLRRAGGELHVPGGIDTLRSGFRVYEGEVYPFVFADSAGRISDLVIDRQGRTPDFVLESYADRMGWGAGGGGGVVGATKLAGVALTLADSATPSATLNNLTARVPVMIGAPASEWRLHIRNYNDKTATAYPGALSFTGVYLGEHERDAQGLLSGAFKAAPRQVAGAFTSSAVGEEWVGPWVTDHPLKAGKDYLVSYGYTSAEQSNYLASAGGWTTTNASDVAALTPARTAVKSVPLDVWIEVRIPAETKINGYVGDSLLLGIQATLPVYDSWAAKHAIANGAIHSVYAIGGTQATDWTDTAARRLAKWETLAKPDAAILALGNNDIFSYSVSLATMQARTLAVSAMARSFFCDRVYLTTILPRIDADPSAQAVWSGFNAWLLQTPAGARMTFDFAERIADANGNADPRWASTPTNFHLSSAGYARCAATITHALA